MKVLTEQELVREINQLSWDDIGVTGSSKDVDEDTYDIGKEEYDESIDDFETTAVSTGLTLAQTIDYINRLEDLDKWKYVISGDGMEDSQRGDEFLKGNAIPKDESDMIEICYCCASDWHDWYDWDEVEETNDWYICGECQEFYGVDSYGAVTSK